MIMFKSQDVAGTISKQRVNASHADSAFEAREFW